MSRADDDVMLAGDEALQSALASIPGVSVIVFDHALRIRAVHGTALLRHGYQHERMVGRPASETMRGPAWTRMCPLVMRALDGRSETIRQTSEDGEAVYESTFAPVRRGSRVVAATMTSRDITGQVQAERSLSEATGRLQAVLEHSPMAIYMRDLDERWIVANAETCGIMGCAPGELIGHPMAEAFPPEVYDRLSANDREVLASRAPQSFDEVVVDARTGRERHTWSQKFPVRDAAGGLIGLGGVSLDVTERERDARELVAARGLFETVFQSSPVGMLVSRLHDSGRSEIVQCNAAFAGMVGLGADALIGGHGADLVHPDDRELRERMLTEVLAGRGATTELRFVHRDGSVIWALTSPSLTLGPEGERLIVVQTVDISQRKELEARLQHFADRDALTGLFSRRRFEEDLVRELSRARRHRRPLGLLLLDLDGFKAVNDFLGHSAGDALLVRISDALREVVRESDVLARIGGDEFALILPDTDAAQSHVVAEKLVAAVRSHGAVLRDGRRAAVTVSIGITALDGRRGVDAAQLLREADEAMYTGKAAGRDVVVTHAAPAASDAAA